jgi:hypothetical protein
MRKIKLVCLLVGALVAPLTSHAQNRGRDRGTRGEGRPAEGRAPEGRTTSVRAIVIGVSKERGATDRRVAPYESYLRAYFPSESFHYVAESSAAVPAGGKVALSVQRQHLDLQGEAGSVFVRTGKGGASLTPGGPGAVFVINSALAIIVIAR